MLAPDRRYPFQEVVIVGTQGWGTGFGLELFGGELTFKDHQRLADQSLTGVLSGIYFGRDVRLRGYYWRGWDSDSSEAAPIQSYGGEVQFSVLGGSIVHPFLIAGGGEIDFMEGYTDLDGEAREDETTWIAGGGLTIRPLSWLDLSVAYRSYFLKDPGARDEWDANGLWTASVGFRFGGLPKEAQVAGVTGTAGGAPGAAGGVPPGTAMIPIPAGGGEIRVVYGADTLRMADSTQAAGVLLVGATTLEAVKSVVSAELSYLDALYPERVALGAPRAALTGDQADTLTRRMGFRTNEIFDYILTSQATAIHEAVRAEMTARGVDQAAQAQVLAKVDSVLNDRVRYNAERTKAVRLAADSAYARQMREAADADKRQFTVAIGGFSQFHLDGRTSFRSPWLRDLRLGPEVAVGFGTATTAMAAVNAHYMFGSDSNLRPYVGLGLGILVRGGEIDGESGTSLVLNPALGLEVRSASAAVFGRTATGYFAELQGVDLFKDVRLLAGIAWRF
jgi:hypothetical protein